MHIEGITNMTGVPIKFDINLKGKCTQILGDSGAGKSLLYRYLIAQKGICGFNIEHKIMQDEIITAIDRIKNKHKLIVIDNFDVMCTQALDDYIANDKSECSYLIIGSGVYACTGGIYKGFTCERACKRRA